MNQNPSCCFFLFLFLWIWHSWRGNYFGNNFGKFHYEKSVLQYTHLANIFKLSPKSAFGSSQFGWCLWVTHVPNWNRGWLRGRKRERGCASMSLQCSCDVDVCHRGESQKTEVRMEGLAASVVPVLPHSQNNVSHLCLHTHISLWEIHHELSPQNRR